MDPEAPTAAEVLANPVVQAAFAAAWADSFVDDPALRHEEGGFIYCEPTTGEVRERRAPPGDRRSIDLSHPPVVPGCYLVATYHTHPKLIADGGDPDPSPEDRELAADSGVPWFVVTELGVVVVGPHRREGGLTGPTGYPRQRSLSMTAAQLTPAAAVSSRQALAIAEADALPVYEDLTPYRIEVRREPDGWHVEYRFRGTGRFHTGGGPHYVIDAATGAIVSKKYHQ